MGSHIVTYNTTVYKLAHHYVLNTTSISTSSWLMTLTLLNLNAFPHSTSWHFSVLVFLKKKKTHCVILLPFKQHLFKNAAYLSDYNRRLYYILKDKLSRVWERKRYPVKMRVNIVFLPQGSRVCASTYLWHACLYLLSKILATNGCMVDWYTSL